MPRVLKILLVESEPANVVALAAAVRSQNWEVVVANDAMMAMKMAREAKPDAVVLGSRVVGGGSLIALKRIRSSAHSAYLPVVAIASTDADRNALRAAGAQVCLAEPVEPSLLASALEQHALQPVAVLEAPAETLGAPARVAALQRTGLLDSPVDESFDRISQLACHLLQTPTALVTIVDQDRQFFKSQTGLREPWASARQTPLTHSFCQWVVAAQEEVVVNDARQHQVLHNNRAIEDLGVVAYAGVPISSADGQAIGSLCAIDSSPRAWSEADVATLRDLREIAQAYALATAAAPVRAAAARKAVAGATRILLRPTRRVTETQRQHLVTIIDEQSRHIIT